MNCPKELKYTANHEWVKIEGNRATVGITDFAQSQLGDVVFIELPAVGAKVTVGKGFAVVESVKAVSDIYGPVNGVVVEANEELADAPELVNQDAYGKGWIAVIELSDDRSGEALIGSEEYAASAAEEVIKMTWSYLPHTPEDRRAMLDAIGVQQAEELFTDIPAALRLQRPLSLPAALSEPELVRHLQELAGENLNFEQSACFLGAGAYDHYIPSVVDHVIRRSEFYTAYTQYQPEISQGYLQALWEYQSMICTLTGMAVANASMYDGGTALAEAAMMACGATGRSQVLVARSTHPHYRAVLATYGRDRDYSLEEIGCADGVVDLQELDGKLSAATAAVIIQNPNFLGCVEDLAAIAARVHAQGALFIVSADPISLGILAAPGDCGADIVTGEGQGMGLAVAFGGPYLGFFAATEKLMRKMPGRIVGQTQDQEGTRGFVLTLQAREQHIRREKATSNICSNEALCALTAAVYLSAVGRDGLEQVARLCLQKAAYAREQLAVQAGCRALFTAPHFKEFVIACPRPVKEINAALREKNIIGGLDLSDCYPELGPAMLVCVTEKRTRQEIDRLVAEMGAMK